MEKFVIEEFVGQMNNPPRGMHKAPTQLRGFEFSRRGGYRLGDPLIHINTVGAEFSMETIPLRIHDDGGLSLFHHLTDKSSPPRLIDASAPRTYDMQLATHREPYLIEGVGAFDYFTTTKPYIVLQGNNLHTDGPQGIYNSIDYEWGMLATSGIGPIVLKVSVIDGAITAGDWRVLALHLAQTPGGLHVVSATTRQLAGFAGTVGWEFTAGPSEVRRKQYSIVSHIYLKGPGTGGDYVLAGTATQATPLRVADSPLGPILPSATNALVLTAPPYMRAVSHQGRYYWPLREMRNIAMTTENEFGPETLAKSVTDRAKGESIVAFSEAGYTNLTTPDSWFTLNFQAGGEITGMASTPAGLLIFSKGETQLLLGDPTSAEAELKRLSSVVGHDYRDRPPARLGGAVFCISDGRIFQIALGMGDVDFGDEGVKDISAPIFDPEYPFLQVVADPTRHSIVARRQQRTVAATGWDEILRYDIEVGQWVQWDDPTGYILLPASGGRGWRGAGMFSTHDADARFLGSDDINIDPSDQWQIDPVLRFDDMDLGEPDLVKTWRAIELHFESRLAWSTGGNYGITLRVATGDGPSNGMWQTFTKPLPQNNESTFLFKLGRGLTARRLTIEFTFDDYALRHNFEASRSGGRRPVLRPPLVIHYQPRRRER